MPLDLEQVHEYQKVPGTNQMRLIRTNPAIRIMGESHTPVWIQDGKFYYEGGDLVPLPIPAWLTEELKRLTPEARAEVGLGEPRSKSDAR